MFGSVLKWVVLLMVNAKNSFGSPYNFGSLTKTSDDCECGYGVSGRIVNGEEAKAHAYPWMVMIMYNGQMHCGGSLINDRYVVTAGHCVNGLQADKFEIFLGVHDLLQQQLELKGGVKAEVEKLIVHEDFASDYLHDMQDIGLIRLKPVNFTKNINPVCLPISDNTYDSGNAIVSGWGRMSQGGHTAKTLRQTTLQLMSNQECRKIDEISEHVLVSNLCAHEKGTDACQGDSGGPLITHAVDDGRPVLIGIVSWGIGCARPGVPGIYTRVTSFMDWIAVHTKDAYYCAYPATTNQ